MKKRYYTVTDATSKLYSLTGNQVKALSRRYPEWFAEGSLVDHASALDWIQRNGRYLGEIDCYAY